MKRSGKKLVGLALAVALAASTAFTSFGFYQEPASKKGLLLHATQEMVNDFMELGCKQAEICASSADIAGYVPWAEQLKNNGITVTMIVLNDFNAGDRDLLPVSEEQDGVGRYAFNSKTPEGEASVRAFARQAASLYKDTVSNWIIGNEVNDASVWDYDGTTTIDAHADVYAKTFRIFYEEIKAANPDARVFIPFDHNWNVPDKNVTNGGATPYRYRSKDFLLRLNDRLKDLSYNVAWHPYPLDMTRPEIDTPDERKYSTDDENALIVDMFNLHVLTDYLQRPEMLAPDGSVRRVILSEQGFSSSSASGEAGAAAAITQAYEIAKANPYVDAFLLHRQVDSKSQVSAGQAYGLWTSDPNSEKDEAPLSKKSTWAVYQSLQ